MTTKSMTRKRRRLALIGGAMAILALALALILTSLGGSIAFFASPTDIAEKVMRPGQRLRLGGLVEKGSVARPDGVTVRFRVTDMKTSIPVAYQGIVPDLFREGQGVVVEGALDADGTFRADTLLARHDERYMPREVVDSLKAQGRWEDYSQGASRP